MKSSILRRSLALVTESGSNRPFPLSPTGTVPAILHGRSETSNVWIGPDTRLAVHEALPYVADPGAQGRDKAEPGDNDTPHFRTDPPYFIG